MRHRQILHVGGWAKIPTLNPDLQGERVAHAVSLLTCATVTPCKVEMLQDTLFCFPTPHTKQKLNELNRLPELFVSPLSEEGTRNFSNHKHKNVQCQKIATCMTTCSVNKTAPTQVRMHGTAECSGPPSFSWSGAIATSRDHTRTLGESNPAGGISPSRAYGSPRRKRADGQPGPLLQGVTAYSEDLLRSSQLM